MRENPTRKRTRVETEELRGVSPIRDQAPTVVSSEAKRSEEIGGFEAYLEQPMLSPVADQGIPAHTIAKKIGEESENEKSSSS